MPRTKKDETLTRLRRIEDKVDNLTHSSIKQWLAALGFGIMIASVAMMFQNVGVSIMMFVVGGIMAALARFLPRQRGKS
jgi:uncharacterized membrane protein YjjP (DUF1212 family)